MDNLWQRRAENGKPSSQSWKDDLKPRSYQPAKPKSDVLGKPPGTPSSVASNHAASPSAGSAFAFGFGSGAFASFGANAKKGDDASVTADPKDEGKDKQYEEQDRRHRNDHTLKTAWVVWYRPPTAKYSSYEKSTIALAHFYSAESFWTVYSHLKRPSSLPFVSDYHIFQQGIRPVWEDEENKRGGKWIMRLKKGVADRYWEDLLLAIVGDQFGDAGEEICGVVLSVRSGEDVLSIWTKVDGGRNVRIRDSLKTVLGLPVDTTILWKSHDASIAQRSAINQARQDKASSGGQHAINNSGKRRVASNETPDAA